MYLTLEKDVDINKAKFFDRKGNFLFTYERELNTGELPKPNMTPYIFPLFDSLYHLEKEVGVIILW